MKKLTVALVILLLSSCALRAPAFRPDQFLFGQIENRPEGVVQKFFVQFGRAFGPDGIKHFSELSKEDQEALLNRVPVLRTNHTDWDGPLKNTPRTWTTWVGGQKPTANSVIYGQLSQRSIRPDGTLYPIPACGDVYVVRGYMASTDDACFHTRFGWRYDDIDDYWSLDTAAKKVGDRARQPNPIAY